MNRVEAGDRNPVVALPETRQLSILADLLERRGATVVRCPMVAILDAPDAGLVVDWLRRFIESQLDLLLIYTGEGLERLLGFAEREGIRDEFVAALSRTRKLVRGPKPVRALRKVGLKPEIVASAPTTDGIIETLQSLELDGSRVGVQLYGSEPNDALMKYLSGRGAIVDSVAPYIYASEADDEHVTGLIERMSAGEIDAIAFTSKAQVERLQKVARQSGADKVLDEALAAIVVAAIGPVVADELRGMGVRVDVMPETSFSMKPLVTELLTALRT